MHVRGATEAWGEVRTAATVWIEGWVLSGLWWQMHRESGTGRFGLIFEMVIWIW